MSQKTSKSSKKSVLGTYDLKHDLKPGRHPCECQAREHKLINNCLGCGRIVCEQEGSGPCFFCSQLVCTKDEQEILDRKSKKSEQLFAKLIGDPSKNASGMSLADISKSMQQAIDYRNKLLAADADTMRQTRVNDLESDYYNLENNPYLTAEERETIIARKEELRQMRMKRERAIVVDLDLANATATSSKKDEIENANDPVIQAVLTKSRFRRPEFSDASLLEEQRKAINDFVPKYDSSYSSASIPNNPMSFSEDLTVQDEEAMFAEVERRGYCICLDQPMASFVVHGLRRHLLWHEDIRLKGPVLISASVIAPSVDKIEKERSNLKKTLGSNRSITFPSDYPHGAILGRVLVYECLTWEEYLNDYPEGECSSVRDGFVLILKNPEPLLAPIPHIPQAKFYQVKKELKNTVKQLLDPYFLG